MNLTILLKWLIPASGVLALLYAFTRTRWVNRQDRGTDRMIDLSNNIAEGARTFLNREYRWLSIFVAVVAGLLIVANVNQPNSSWWIGVSFVAGAFCSGLAGFIGMTVATKANVRTTQAARTSLGPAMNVAFSGGLVMGLSVVGLGVIGLGGLFLLYDNALGWELPKVINVI
ncbi:MAG: sodium/proton-translocating pyrophosphatase, partial [Salinibacter sp.]